MSEVRLFVGNIPSQATEQDITNEFGYYGKVKSVELKKKGNENCYGFVNLNIEEKILQKCIREFTQQKFMGNYLSVSKAKESFLDRLKKEREGNSIGSKLLEMSIGETYEELKTEKFNEIKPELPVIQREVSSSEEESSSSEEEEIVVKQKPRIVTTKSNDYPPQKLDKAALDELKRQESVKKLKEIHKEKQNAIRNALSSFDSGPRNNKIIFEPPEEIPSIVKDMKDKSKLFEDDDEEVESIPKNFKVKKQFEGKKGEKLFELQSRFQGDERFTIDEKFADDPDAIDKYKKYTREELRERKKYRKEMQDWDQEGMKEERDHQMDILNSITGESPSIKTDNFSRPIQKGMLRFDPTKKSHQKYLDIVRGDEVLEEDEKNSDESCSEDEKSAKPEKFFEVSENLAFNNAEAKPFSILGMLGIKHDDDESINNNKTSVQKEIKTIVKPKSLPFGGARFRFESSDSDSEVEEAKMKNVKRKAKNSQTASKFGKYSKNGVFHYNLFYHVDDERLKEGFQFLIKTETTTKPENAQEQRQKLKTVVRNSVRKARQDKINRKSNVKKFKAH